MDHFIILELSEVFDFCEVMGVQTRQTHCDGVLDKDKDGHTLSWCPIFNSDHVLGIDVPVGDGCIR